VRYVDWVDPVLVALDDLARRDPNVSLIGLSLRELMRELRVGQEQHGDAAVVVAGNDLELLNCAEAEHARIKVTAQGQRFARAGGLRPGWNPLFQHAPLEEDRTVLAKAVELSVHEADTYAWTERVEMKEVLRQVRQPSDQGTAIAVTKRLEEAKCIHPNAVMTMGGNEGRCEVLPSYVGIVISTEQLATEERTLLASLVDEWETTGVDVKEVLALGSERQKAEFCKDILALANTRVSGRRFLVAGFNDATRKFTASVDRAVDAHRMESLLAAYCRPVPRIRYSIVPLTGGNAGLIEVLSDRKSLPYKLARDVWKLKAGSVFVRHNTLVEVASGEELTILIAEGDRARSQPV
jgi:Schlafen, AlbA_2